VIGIFQLRLVQKILGLSIMLLLVLEVVYGWGEWPDETYVGSLEKKLMLDLQKQDVVAAGGVSSAWTNTQKLVINYKTLGFLEISSFFL